MTYDFEKLTVAHHPLVQSKMARLRDATTPTREFRRLVDEITTLITYEATRDMELVDREIKTPVALAQCKVLRDPEVVLVPVLRAGLGMVDPVVALLPDAKVGHLGMYRDPETHLPVEYYANLPHDIGTRDVFVLDPMLATGGSAAAAISYIKEHGGARSITFMCIMAAREGVRCLTEAHPDVRIIAAAFDEELTPNAYITPGLGDAGDRLFGTL